MNIIMSGVSACASVRDCENVCVCLSVCMCLCMCLCPCVSVHLFCSTFVGTHENTTQGV